MSAVIPHRDGITYDHARDARRLAGQHCRVLAFLKDGQWHTLGEIAEHSLFRYRLRVGQLELVTN